MIKSHVLYNVEDYKKWMFENFWTNKNYQPPRWDMPADHQFPLIAIGMTAQNYRGRDEDYIEVVELRDFQEAPVYLVTETQEIPEIFGSEYIDVFFGVFATERDAQQEIGYVQDEFRKHNIKPIKLNEVQP